MTDSYARVRIRLELSEDVGFSDVRVHETYEPDIESATKDPVTGESMPLNYIVFRRRFIIIGSRGYVYTQGIWREGRGLLVHNLSTQSNINCVYPSYGYTQVAIPPGRVAWVPQIGTVSGDIILLNTYVNGEFLPLPVDLSVIGTGLE